MDNFYFVLILSLVGSAVGRVFNNINDQLQFSVLQHGAIGDGETDDTDAFIKAWNATCGTATGIPTMIIDADKTFLVNPTVFKGPCKPGNVNVKIEGTLIAPEDPMTWKDMEASLWLHFESVDGLTIDGSGTINGRGTKWWQQSCRLNPKLGCTKLAPTAIKFVWCNNLRVSDLKLMDSPQTHVLIHNSQYVNISRLNIAAPGDSPNTDGIHIQSSQHVVIEDSIIGSGDDCISIGDFNYNFSISRITCGPGHGISIGSLGKGHTKASVEEIHIKHANFTNTTNGARIKTWQGGMGYARMISFEYINLTDVENPIIIDQYYCDVRNQCAAEKTAVEISNVRYAHFQGTSKTPLAISLNCSQSVGCTGIHLDDVNIMATNSEENIQASCINVHGEIIGSVNPTLPCLQNLAFTKA